MASETVERKFWYGGSAFGLAWCMYSVPIQREGWHVRMYNSRGIGLLSVVGKIYDSVEKKWQGWNWLWQSTIGED